MALRDAVQLSSTTHDYTGGTGANGIDGDFATAQTVTGSGQNGSATSTVIATHTFGSAKKIEKTTYKLRSYTSNTGNAPLSRTHTETIEYLIGGSWTTVYSYSFSSPGEGTKDNDPGAVSYSTSTANVSAVKATVTTYCLAGDGGYTATSYIYEVQSFYTIKKSYAGYY